MDKKRSLSTRLWIDNWVLDLDPVEKLLFIYLLTNQSTNLAGIYELHLRKMAFETGIDREMVQKILTRFEKDGKIIYKHGFVFVLNFTKHQGYNDKMLININETLENLPDKVKNDTVLIPIVKGIYSLCIPMREIEREKEIKTKIQTKKEGIEIENVNTPNFYVLMSDSGIKPEDVKTMINETPDLTGADPEYYFNRALDWSLSNDKKGPNWLATIRTFIRNDIKEGKLIKIKEGMTDEQYKRVWGS